MARRRPSRPLTSEQKYLDAILGELRGINAKLDGQATVSARPASGQSEKVRLEEPVRSTSADTIGPPSTVGPPDEGIDVENDAPTSPSDGREHCRETTRRGHICGKPLPCRYHG